MSKTISVQAAILRVSRLKNQQTFRISNACRMLHKLTQIENYLKSLDPTQEITFTYIKKRFKTILK